MKRGRENEEGADVKPDPDQEAAKPKEEDFDEDDYDRDDYADVKAEAGADGRPANPVRQCPYLDTINRHVLDFDFEKVCSVSNSHLNVYVCLVCGKYFQGRPRGSPAYFHALEFNHHVFMKLDSGRVFCIPDNYEVIDTSLADIKFNLNPSYAKDQIVTLDTQVRYSRGIDGTEYIPGTVGLNNLKNTAYLNVIIQALTCVSPLRDFFLLSSNYARVRSPLVQRFGELLCKMWNPKAFKGQVSPHELFQAISVESNRRYRSDVHSDPAEFLSWFLNSLHRGLGGTDRRGSSIIHRVFQGQVRMDSRRIVIKKGDKKGERGAAGGGGGDGAAAWETDALPFLHLTLDLPPTPLYADSLEKNIIPQVPIVTILHKFDGRTETHVRGFLKRFRLLQLPPYLILHIKRFSKNTQFQIEKNPTIVSFPIKNLDLLDFVDLPSPLPADAAVTRYDLVANICHEGLVTKAATTNEVHDKGIATKEGVFRVQVLNKAQEQWYQLDDLHIQEILPQVVSISEAYVQIYERADLTASRKHRRAAQQR